MNFFESKEPVESNDEELTLEKLNEMGVDYKHWPDKNGKQIYRFFNITEISPGVFNLKAKDKKVIFYAVHFDNGKFKSLQDKNIEISPEDLFGQVSEKFPNVNEIIYSCCYPSSAKEAIENLENKPIILGSGNSEYNTRYNNIANYITIASTSK